MSRYGNNRFSATKECIYAHAIYKKQIIASSETDTTVIKRSIGTSARALSNSWTDKIIQIEANDPKYEALKAYISGEANQSYFYDGKQEDGFGWAGQIVGRIHEELPVSELMKQDCH